jgi:hypothetical protein
VLGDQVLLFMNKEKKKLKNTETVRHTRLILQVITERDYKIRVCLL